MPTIVADADSVRENSNCPQPEHLSFLLFVFHDGNLVLSGTAHFTFTENRLGQDVCTALPLFYEQVDFPEQRGANWQKAVLFTFHDALGKECVCQV